MYGASGTGSRQRGRATKAIASGSKARDGFRVSAIEMNVNVSDVSA
jgi:hypothetical protein